MGLPLPPILLTGIFIHITTKVQHNGQKQLRLMMLMMFRNWINGNRDLYLITSSNNGKTFGQAQKLGVGNWKLNGCPMDGGGLAVNKNGTAETVWRREGKIYAST